MEIFAYSVDWDNVVEHFQAGTLGENLSDVPSGAFGTWVEELELESDSDAHYHSVAESYGQLREGLTENVRSLADAFFNPLITFDGHCSDLNHGAMFLLSISPHSVSRFAEVGNAIDFEKLRDAFYEKCDDSEKESLAEFGNCTIDQSFENGFLPYVQMWFIILKEAAESGKGLLVYMG